MRKVEVPAEPRALPDGPLYFVGIGGAGMSALAYVLAQRGRTVAGSDPGISLTVRERLESVGVKVYTAHHAAHVGDAAVVVVSDAIPEANPEVVLAQQKGIPIVRRPEVLASIVNAGRGIAIAGTHGKTTTTGMVASILLAAGLDPTILIGGDLPAIGGNARNGKGDFVVAESCEAYDGFLYLHPEIAVVLNIEADHLDYHGTEQHVFESFYRFMGQTSGFIIANEDDPNAEVFAHKAGGLSDTGVLTYTVKGARDGQFRAEGIEPVSTGTRFHVADHGDITLPVPGLHNVSNALAAVAAASALGIDWQPIVAGLEAFTGTGRRFEKLGEVSGVLVVDDYAHHPTEIKATLTAARSAYPERRLVAVFQPHLPSRTRDNMDAFAGALAPPAPVNGGAGNGSEGGPDVVYVTDIYLAREQPLPGVSSAVLSERIKANKPGLPMYYVADKNELPARLAAEVRPGDIVLVMGAGDIRKAGEGLVKALGERKS